MTNYEKEVKEAFNRWEDSDYERPISSGRMAKLQLHSE